jgi:hypothetical protein
MLKKMTVFAMLCATPTLAIAGQCQDDITAIDKALERPELDADVRSQVEDMRNQAVQLCGAGNEDEGVAVTTEARALLGLQ